MLMWRLLVTEAFNVLGVDQGTSETDKLLQGSLLRSQEYPGMIQLSSFSLLIHQNALFPLIAGTYMEQVSTSFRDNPKKSRFSCKSDSICS